jgi:spore coat protein A
VLVFYLPVLLCSNSFIINNYLIIPIQICATQKWDNNPMNALNTIRSPQKPNATKKIFIPLLIISLLFDLVAPVIGIANASPATQLAFTTQASGIATAGYAFPKQPIVTLQDGVGATDITATSTVTLAAFSDAACTVPATGILSGTASQAAVAGVAAFSGLSFDTPGTIYLQAADGVLTPTCSAPIIIAPMGIATALSFSTQPSAAATTSAAFGQQPVVKLQDGMGMLDATATNSVAISAYSDAACTIPATGALIGTTTISAAGGYAGFSGLGFDTAGTIYLGASSTILAPACSSAISVTAAPLPAPAPLLTSVSILSSNASTSIANIGNTVTLSFTSDIALSGLPIVTIAGNPATTTAGVGNSFTSTYIMTLADVAGAVPFTVDFTSASGTPGIQVSATTDATSVEFLGLAKFVDALPIPGVIAPLSTLADGTKYYEISMTQATQQLHRDMPATTIWGYNGTTPAGTIEARKGVPIRVKWINNLPTTHVLGPVDTAIHGADMGAPAVRTVVHLHGGEVPPTSDGDPMKWYTPNPAGPQLFSTAMPGMPAGPIGIPGNFEIDDYPNIQQAATLWYHDHAMGATRLNVVSGLAGFYLLRDDNEDSLNLPKGAFEIPIAIQDRKFNADGSLAYPNPWSPEYFGDKIMVNGKVWPYASVEPRKYRLRLLDGSNARVYNLQLLESDANGKVLATQTSNPNFIQIGSDGGFLASPVVASTSGLLIAPGERQDVIVDFSAYAGKNFVMSNNAEAPYQTGATNLGAISDIMMFKVLATTSAPDTSSIPGVLNTITPISQTGATSRDIKMTEILDPVTGAPQMMLLNGHPMSAIASDTPINNTTEIWRFINTTMDTHPMHMHLVEFQVLGRQEYLKDAMGMPLLDALGNVQPTGPVFPPEPNETGWKDTFRSPPGMISSVIARFGSFTGRYVYHCHILEHEDNDMMLPFEVLPASATNTPPVISSIAPQTVGSGTPVSIQVLATDANANVLSYSLVAAPTGASINPATGLISWTPSSIGTTTFTVIVNDGYSISTSPVTVVSTAALGAPPAITPLMPLIGTSSSALLIPVTATSAAGTPLSFSLYGAPAGAAINPSTGIVTFLTASAGTFNFYVQASDGASVVSAPVNIVINPAPAGAPVITPIPAQAGTSTVITTIPVAATSSAGTPLTYSLLNAPAGATIDPVTGIVTFLPATVGTFDFFVQASDGTTTVSAPVSVTVSPAPAGAPVITPIPAQTGTSTVISTIPVSATSSTGTTLTYSLLNEPAGITIDPATGIITVNSTATGTFNFLVQASDGVTTVSMPIDITINEAPPIPITITPVPPQTATSGTSSSIIISATSSSGSTLTYSLIGEPAGVTIDPASGIITVLSAATGTVTFDVQATDGVYTATSTITLTINEAPIAPPVITPIPPQNATSGVAMTIQVEATSSSGLALSYTLFGEPTGASINPFTGLISYTPATSGPVSFTVQVSDGTRFSVADINISVSPAPVPPPTISAIPPQTATTSEALLIQVEATSSAGLSLSYALSGAPAETSIDPASGLITFISTTSGIISFYVEVSDGTNETDSLITVTVNDAPIPAPTITAIPDQTGTVGVPMTIQVDATSSAGLTLTYSLVSAPLGASIDTATGLISYTPASAGLATLNIEVTDGTNIASTTANVNVSAAPIPAPTITAIPDQTGTVGVPMTIQVDATSSAGLTLAYSLVSAPLGASIDTATGLISYTPISSGFATFEVGVSDGTNLASSTFAVTVNPAPINNLPSVTAIADQSLDLGISLTLPVMATDTDGDLLAYSLENPPTGALINPSTGIFSWTPVSAGTFAINVVVSDGHGSSTASFNAAVKLNVDSADLSTLITGGVFLPDSTSSPTSTPTITVSQPLTINIPSGAATSTVTLPQGTIITRADGSNIDAQTISAGAVTLSSLSNLGTNMSADGAIQWGIPNLGLVFNQPISLSIYVGTSLNGQVLNIMRSVTGTANWTSDGVSPATTTVVNGFVHFTATKASYYAASHQVTPVVAPPASSGGGGGVPIYFLQQKTVTPSSTIATTTPLTQPIGELVTKIVLGVKTYADGTLLKNSIGRIYLITQNQKKYIRSLVELSHLVSQKIILVSDEILNQIPLFTAPANAGRNFGDGNLIRDTKTKKIYLLGSGVRKPISNLIELQKYAGRKIYDATADELAKYPIVQQVKNGVKAYPESSFLRDKNTKQVYFIKNGAKKPATAPAATIKDVDNDILEHYPLNN